MGDRWKQLEDILKTDAPAEMNRMGLSWLIMAGILTAVLWQIPGGDYILYPFTILATWFHEMGHGLMALILGGNFVKLEIFSSGSGVATYAAPFSWSPIHRALVAAAGPMGPPIAGATLILVSRNRFATNWCLKLLGVFLIISTIIWVRSPFGFVFIPLLGAVIFGLGLIPSPSIKGFMIQFLGVQACVSTYHQLNYLYSYRAGPFGLSDTAQIQQELFLPYWFWATLMAVASAAILFQSLRIAYRS